MVAQGLRLQQCACWLAGDRMKVVLWPVCVPPALWGAMFHGAAAARGWLHPEVALCVHVRRLPFPGAVLRPRRLPSLLPFLTRISLPWEEGGSWTPGLGAFPWVCSSCSGGPAQASCCTCLQVTGGWGRSRGTCQHFSPLPISASELILPLKKKITSTIQIIN